MMQTELTAIDSQSTKPEQHESFDEASNKDDCPLLNPDPIRSHHHHQTTNPPQQQPNGSTSVDDLEKKYVAFVRSDVYGTMGKGELQVGEKMKLGLALVTLVPLRVVVGVTILVVYYFICRVATLFKAPNREEEMENEQEDYAHMGGLRRMVIVQCGRFLSRVMLYVFGFYWIKVTYIQMRMKEKICPWNRKGLEQSCRIMCLMWTYCIICPLPFQALLPRSVAKFPLVGLISKCLGCVFVQRESKFSDFKGVSAVVTERVREAHQNRDAPMMMLFPEGTTTNGDYLLPFKTGAFLSKAPVLPVILRYPYQRLSPAWDSISGTRHVLLLLCQFVNFMEVTRLPIYYPSEQEKDNPKLYADNIRKLMAREGNIIMSDIGLPEKRIYHAAINGLFC